MVVDVTSTEQEEGSENKEQPPQEESNKEDVTGSETINEQQKDATIITATSGNDDEGDHPNLGTEPSHVGFADVGEEENEEEPHEGEEEGEEEKEKKEGEEGEEEGDTENVKELKKELSKIIVTTPHATHRKLEDFDPMDFPPSYRSNNEKEKTVLEYAENFRCQYVHLYRDRKPLLLYPKNECDVQKFVCVTIRPTVLPFPELYEWDKAASFVSDYLICEMLEPPYELPNQILSPTTVMKRQKGNCFEYSTMLCSLLLGAGYDAYVVSGYATHDICLADESREICPFLRKAPEVEQKDPPKPIKKYTVKPPKDLTSKFEKKQLARIKAKEEEALEKQRLAEIEAELALEPKATDDPLYGLRVHSWVLVEAGKREVPESFFIEPFTGLPMPLLNEKYLGIESVWNNQNYWVNMQDCSKGVMEMSYDLGDCVKWEYMFPFSDNKPTLLLPEEDVDMEFEEEVEKTSEVIDNYLNMPHSWVAPLQITLNDFQMRHPGGKKTIFYKRAKLEKFAMYLMPDGLITRVSVYEDNNMTELIQVLEFFLNRGDGLFTREFDHRKGWIHEYFHEGRPKCLKEHLYKFNSTSPESERKLIYYHHSRVDGLEIRTMSPTEMTEYFVDRDDYLFYRQTEFGEKKHVFAPQDAHDSVNDRPIVKIVEKFHRNPAKAANDDIFIRTFTDHKISIIYHTDDKCITYSTREFIKSPTWTDKNAPSIGWNSELHTAFQVGPSAGIKKEVDLYQFLREILNDDVLSREAVRESEVEVKEILDGRAIEEAASNLDVSVYDTQRNEKALARREKMKEKQELEERLRREALEVDYLAPFLAQISDPENLTKLEASTVQKACLEDLRQRLLEKANLIQQRFEKETDELLKKQEWYQKNQISMQKEDEDEYSKYVEAALFRIHILEVRLNRHKEMATQKYKSLERKLRNDPRLSELFI